MPNLNKEAHASIPKAVEDCRSLLMWILPHIDKLPKNRRYTLGEKLENRITDNTPAAFHF